MKKFISFVAAVLVGIASLTAQDNYKPVKGYVLDTNGNPIAGAEVKPTGGGTSSITDADGSFTMNVHPYLKTLTATYAGMGTKKLKVNYDKDMVFRMKSAWRTRGFISLIGNLGYSYEYYNSPIIGCGGIMAGALGKWGGYGKVTFGRKEEVTNITATIGLIKGCSSMVYIYLGGGYGQHHGYSDNEPAYGAAFDLGCIIKPSKHFSFSIGGTISSDFDSYPTGGADIGVGYVF